MASEIDAWLPKSVILLRDYDRHKFVSDLAAGVTVGLVALPLAMAFAVASGVPPQAGLYLAIVTGFVISAFGGSKTQIGGPTGAFVVAVAGIITKHGIEGLLLLLCGAREQPAQLMKQAEFERHAGGENICPSITDAIARAADLHRAQPDSGTLLAN
jgi:sulfate permease family protein